MEDAPLVLLFGWSEKKLPDSPCLLPLGPKTQGQGKDVIKVIVVVAVPLSLVVSLVASRVVRSLLYLR